MKRRKMENISKFLRDEAGLELSEYVIAAALITVAVIVAFMSVGSAIGDKILALAGYLK